MTSQHMRALIRANEVRLRRAEIKAELKRGDMTVAEAVEDPATATMRVYDLIMCLPGYGHQRTRKLLAACSATESTTVEGLRERRMKLLLDEVHARFGGVK